MFPTRDFSLGGRAMSFYTPEPVPEPAPTQSPPSVKHIHAGNSWGSHVKEVYSMLKSVDPSTTLREAMTHAKVSESIFDISDSQ